MVTLANKRLERISDGLKMQCCLILNTHMVIPLIKVKIPSTPFNLAPLKIIGLTSWKQL